MKDNDKLTVCFGECAEQDAQAIAKRVGAPLSDTLGPDLTLLVDSSGVSLVGYGMTYRGDFEKMLKRITDGRLKHEMLVHVSKTDIAQPTAIDATAGMGEDSFLLAAAGYQVTMFEQNPVIEVLLKDAMKRAKKHPLLSEIIDRMNLIGGNSIELLPKQNHADLIYLDPMFPARRKSGLVNKKLQLIQHLEQPCVEEADLLQAAMSLNPRKIIIKRPLKGAFLADRKPQYSVKGKAIRYDCFVFAAK